MPGRLRREGGIEMDEKHVFFKDNAPDELQRGMFYRSMGIGRFITDCEVKGYKIHGVIFDDDNNCEFLFESP